MDVRRIEYFLAVADTLSFTKAAAQLHISHQALSKQIQLLEGELGAKLLERSTTRVALTPAGEKLSETFRPLLRALVYGYSEVLEFIDRSSSTLRVGYFSGLSYSRIIRPVIERLEEDVPGSRVSLQAADINAVEGLLEQDKIDLAVVPSFGEQSWKGLTCLTVYSSPQYIIVSENHPWYALEKLTRELIESGTLLTYADRVHAPLPELQNLRRIPVENFDTYMGVLRQGEVFGVVGDTYSRREGECKLFPLPPELAADAPVFALFKKAHPLRSQMLSLRGMGKK